jgi:hypothetical protein
MVGWARATQRWGAAVRDCCAYWKERKRASLHWKNMRGKKRKDDKKKKNKEKENWTTFQS